MKEYIVLIDLFLFKAQLDASWTSVNILRFTHVKKFLLPIHLNSVTSLLINLNVVLLKYIVMCEMEKQEFYFQNSAFKCLIYVQNSSFRFLDKKMR